jgi:hypothetical protein
MVGVTDAGVAVCGIGVNSYENSFSECGDEAADPGKDRTSGVDIAGITEDYRIMASGVVRSTDLDMVD